MTEKLYDKDAYAVSFASRVVSADNDGDLTRVVLESTLFFPMEGGQTPDRGTINGLEVTDVRLEGDDIIHLVKGSVSVGDEVPGRIDFEHRFSNMQMHTGEHVFSGYVHSRFGFDNVGFHLSDNDATMDYNGRLEAEDIMQIERLVNEAIYKDVSVKAYFPGADSLEMLDFRSKSGIKGDVRIVEIEGIDLCACCAPHVSSLGQIGIFKIVKFESYKGGTRLHYLAGKRAYEYLSDCFDTVSEVSRTLSVSPEKVSEGVSRLKSELADTRYLLNGERRNGILNEIKGLSKQELRFFFFDSNDKDLIKFVSDEIKNLCGGNSAVFMGNDEAGYRYLIESGERDLSIVQKKMNESLLCKGGGKPSIIQGTVNETREAVKAALESLI